MRSLEGHKVPKEKSQISLDTIHDRDHNPSAEGPSLSPEGITPIRAFPRLTTKLALDGCGGRAACCRRRAPSFSSIGFPTL